MVRPQLIVLAALPWFVFHSIAQTPQRVEFEVATIRLNEACANGGGLEHLSPGRFGVECVSLRDYIRGAHGSYGFGRNPNVRPPKILGGPDWVDTDRYDIVAKAPGETGLDERISGRRCHRSLIPFLKASPEDSRHGRLA